MPTTSRCPAAIRSASTRLPADPNRCGSFLAQNTPPLWVPSPRNSGVACWPSSTLPASSRRKRKRPLAAAGHLLNLGRSLGHLQHQKYPVIFVNAAARMGFHFVPYPAQNFLGTLLPALGYRVRQPRAAVLVARRIHGLGDAVGAGHQKVARPQRYRPAFVARFRK